MEAISHALPDGRFFFCADTMPMTAMTFGSGYSPDHSVLHLLHMPTLAQQPIRCPQFGNWHFVISMLCDKISCSHRVIASDRLALTARLLI